MIGFLKLAHQTCKVDGSFVLFVVSGSGFLFRLEFSKLHCILALCFSSRRANSTGASFRRRCIPQSKPAQTENMYDFPGFVAVVNRKYP